MTPERWRQLKMLARVRRLEATIRKMKAYQKDLYEHLWPFVMHGLAQKVFQHKNGTKAISKIGVSSLTVNAYQLLITVLDPKDFPIMNRYLSKPLLRKLAKERRMWRRMALKEHG